MTEVVPRREDDNDCRRNDNRAACHVRLDEPDISEEAGQDGHREWHEGILPEGHAAIVELSRSHVRT